MGAVAHRGVALVVLLTGCGRSEFVALRADNNEPSQRSLTATFASAGAYQTLVVRDGAIYGTGLNDTGQLGPDNPDTLAFVLVDDSRTWVSAHAGDSHACAVDQTARVYCWGANNDGQLGVGDFEARVTPTEVALPLPVRRLAVRHETACAILTNDELHCWGYNEENGLARPVLFENQARPVEIPAIAGGGWREVGVGQGHMCAIANNGALYCSGRNTERQASENPTAQLGALTQVGAFTNWWWVDATIATSCGLRGGEPGVAGELWCWGDNDDGQLGQGDRLEPGVPVRVGGARLWAKVAVAVLHTCAIDDGGTLACWGRNFEGQLGLGSSPNDVLTVSNVASPMRFREIILGRLHTIAIATDTTVFAAGVNSDGQLGLGDAENRRLPTAIPLP